MAYDKFAAVDSSTLLFPPTVRANLAGVSPNYVINGGFDIWQRGTSFSIAAVSNTYTADRWFATLNQRTSGTLVINRNTTEKQAADQYCVEIDATGVVTTSVIDYTQLLETANVAQLRGQTVTLSFSAKVASGTASVVAKVQDGTDIDAFPATSSTSDSYTAAVGTSWTRYSFTHVVQSGANSLAIRLSTPSAFAGKLYLSRIQLEVGSTATPFRRNANSIQGELAACQRYYFTSGAVLQQGFIVYSGDNTRRVNLSWPVSLRVAPTSGNLSITWSGGTPGVDWLTINQCRAYTSIGNTTTEANVTIYTVNVEL